MAGNIIKDVRLARTPQCANAGQRMFEELLVQGAKAAAYYVTLVILIRLAGKRLAGQTTTFDLIILITLGVVLQGTALQDGAWNAIGISRAELMAGLRKLGHENPDKVKLATLEETGHISAVE